MRLAAIYAAISLATIVGFGAIQLGWRPSFLAIWDGRSRLYLDFTCLLLTLLASGGFGAAIPSQGFPRLLRAVPGLTAISLGCFMLLGALQLSPASTPNEALIKMARAMGYGVALGITVGLISSLGPLPEEDDAGGKRSKPNHAAILGLVAAVSVVGLVLLMLPRTRDDGEFQEYGRFDGEDRELVLGVASPPLIGERYGILRLESGRNSNSLVLERDEWRGFETLWSKAQQTHSGDWLAVGETHDTEASDPARVALSAGPGVRFVVASQHGPTVTFDLVPTEFRRFDAALQRVEHDIDN